MAQSLLVRVALTVALACASLVPVAHARQAGFTGEALTQAREACHGATSATVGASPNANQAIQALRDHAGEGACEGVEIPTPPPALPLVLKAIKDGLSDAEADYQCGVHPDTPSCQGLRSAQARFQDLDAFRRGDTATLRRLPKDVRAAAYHWNELSFGHSPNFGVSLARLVLEAVDPNASLARRTGPGVRYEDIAADLIATAPGCSACGDEVARVISLYPLFDALDRGFMAATPTGFDTSITKLEGHVGRWQAYHFGGGQGRTQLPWELALNSIIYTHHVDREKEWRDPPEYALVLLHPSAGLALKDVHGADVTVAVVELAGVGWWDYDPKTYGRVDEWGASVVTSYRERDDAKDWGYGALIRTPIHIGDMQLNGVWTRTKLNAGGHDDTFAISVDLSRFLPNLKNTACLLNLPSCEQQ